MKKALRWLEMLLNFKAAVRPIGAFWQVFDIPLEAGIGDYDLSDYADERGVCHVFSVFIVNANGEVDPLDMQYQSQAVAENLDQTGRPSRVTVTHSDDEGDGLLSVYPTPTSVEEDAGLKLRVRVETFHEKISDIGTGDVDVRLRPSWYLWATKATAYEIGSGPVRRLSEGELKRLQDDSTRLENDLLAHDGQQISPQPPVTEPVYGSVDGCDYTSPPRNGYRRV
jgi:hypothetical protein